MDEQNNPAKAYGDKDGRIWNDYQREHVAEITADLAKLEDLYALRKQTLWLFDVLFPNGFRYTANKGPSEPIGYEMHGEKL